jgi:hypothetical protein
MKTTALAMAGSLLINFVLGLVVAALFGAAPLAHGAQPQQTQACPGTHATRTESSASRSAAVPAGHPSYVVAARMGWAMG